MLPDQHRFGAGPAEISNFLRLPDTAFADHGHLLGHIPDQLFCGADIRHEGMKIPVIDADKGHAQFKGTLQLGPVMNLHQDIQPDILRDGQKLLHLLRLQDGCDQQHRVRPQEPCFIYLTVVDGKILAQKRKVYGLPYGPQIVIAALEIIRVRQHGDAIRACAAVGFRQPYRMEVLPDEALGGGGFFHLGNQAHRPVAASAQLLSKAEAGCHPGNLRFRLG
ncbi:hypothetical protein D3C75_801780 [compost metagenome]